MLGTKKDWKKEVTKQENGINLIEVTKDELTDYP